MNGLFLVLGALVLVVSAGNADVPYPANCSCTLDQTQRLHLCPHQDQPEGAGACSQASFSVVIRNSANHVIQNAVVEVLVGCQLERLVRLCALNTLYKATNAEGVVHFNIGGGGCCKDVPLAVIIRASGVEIRTYDVVNSADYADIDNVGIPDRSDFDVDPVDLGAFAIAYAGGSGGASCHDYDNNGVTDSIDLITFVEAYKGGGNWCSPGPNAPFR